MWRYLKRPEKGVGALRAGLTGNVSCSHMGAGNWTLSSTRVVCISTVWAICLSIPVLKVLIEIIEMNLTLQVKLPIRPFQLEGMTSERLKVWHTILYLEIMDAEYLESKYSWRNGMMRQGSAEPKESILRTRENQILEALLYKSELRMWPKNLHL